MGNVRLSDSASRGFDVFHAVFPVAAVKPAEPTELSEPRFFGTAFAIAPGLFLTANHVFQAARAVGTVVICGPRGEGEPLGATQVANAEVWPGVDLALLQCGVGDRITLFDVWRFTRCQVLDELRTFGYPHAMVMDDNERRLDVSFRAYKGEVVTTRSFWRLPSRPGVYEVCAPFPEGLSGAPVLWQLENSWGEVRPYLAGIVLGEETVQYGRMRNRVGIALPVDQFVGCVSKITGGRLGELVNVVGTTFGPSPTY